MITLIILAIFGYGAWLLFGTGVRVPPVVKLDRTAAEKAITDAGLLVGNVTEQESGDVAPGTVLEQVPDAGVRTDQGATVDLVVAKLKVEYQAFAPGVVGMGQPDAVSAVQAAGLTAETYFAFSDAIDSGTVVEQYPQSGEGVLPGAPLTLLVSLGPVEDQAAATVPSVVGQRAPAAASAIAGVKLVAQPIVVASDRPPGEVIAQLPAPEVQAPPGAAVAVVVSGGPKIEPDEDGRVRIPGVLNQKVYTAIRALQKAGLQVAVFQTFSSKVPAGGVALQFPQSGTSVRAGSTVLLAVSQGESTGQGVVVPNATGIGGGPASTALQGAGLYPLTFELDVVGSPGQVVQQFPQAGSIVAPGARVGLAVVLTPRPAVPEPTATPAAP